MAESFPEIKTQNYFLRQIGIKDLENVYRGLSNPEVIKHYGISYDTLEATKGQIEWYAGLEKDKTGIWWAICSPDNSTFYGAAGFSSRNEKFQKAEIGFWLYPEYWNKGIVSETLPKVCSYGFGDFGLHRIEAFVEPDNTACKAAMNILGFTHEGTMRECEIANGRFISLDIYSKLKTD